MNKVLVALIEKQSYVPDGAAWAKAGIKVDASREHPLFMAQLTH